MSRVAAVRFWFRQVTPPADNFRHIRSCRRDLAATLLATAGRLRRFAPHEFFTQAQKQIRGFRSVVSLRWHTGNNRPLLSFTLSVSFVSARFSLPSLSPFFFSSLSSLFLLKLQPPGPRPPAPALPMPCPCRCDAADADARGSTSNLLNLPYHYHF